jgi:pentatricopeptide repeat domain-containing protein 1
VLTRSFSSGENGDDDWKKTLEVLREMEDRGVQPDAMSYNAAISACEKSGQYEKALNLWREMEERGVQLPEESTITLTGKQYETLKALADFGMKEMAIPITADNCVLTIRFSSSKKSDDDWKNANEDAMSYSAAISACEKSGQYEKALNLWREMRNEASSCQGSRRSHSQANSIRL